MRIKRAISGAFNFSFAALPAIGLAALVIWGMVAIEQKSAKEREAREAAEQRLAAIEARITAIEAGR